MRQRRLAKLRDPNGSFPKLGVPCKGVILGSGSKVSEKHGHLVGCPHSKNHSILGFPNSGKLPNG